MHVATSFRDVHRYLDRAGQRGIDSGGITQHDVAIPDFQTKEPAPRREVQGRWLGAENGEGRIKVEVQTVRCEIQGHVHE
jgi:hypothetical protein